MLDSLFTMICVVYRCTVVDVLYIPHILMCAMQQEGLFLRSPLPFKLLVKEIAFYISQFSIFIELLESVQIPFLLLTMKLRCYEAQTWIFSQTLLISFIGWTVDNHELVELHGSSSVSHGCVVFMHINLIVRFCFSFVHYFFIFSRLD